LLSEVVLCGGGGAIRGLDERIGSELRQLATAVGGASLPYDADTPQLTPLAPAGRAHHAVWLGAALAANSSSLYPAWLLKRDYDDAGPSAIHARCFF
jgi:actin-related protein